MLDQYQTILTVYQNSDESTFDTHPNGISLVEKIYNKQKKDRGGSMMVKMIRDFITSYFIEQSIFYQYTDEELNVARKTHDVWPAMKLTPVSQVQQQATPKMNTMQMKNGLKHCKMQL